MWIECVEMFLLPCSLLYNVFNAIRWATHWFRVDMQVPDDWVGSDVRLRWNSGSEALVWLDGKPIQVHLNLFVNEKRL